MRNNIFNLKQQRWWGLLPIIFVLWHSIYVVSYLYPDYLVFVCYSANVILGIGILIGSPLLIGAGFGWTLIGLPLWFFDAILTNNWIISGILFHLCGPVLGVLAARHFRFSKHTWILAEGIGIVLYVAARLFTDEALNVNAAFRVYEGWEGLFSNYPLYVVIMLIGYGLFFFILPIITNKFLLVKQP